MNIYDVQRKCMNDDLDSFVLENKAGVRYTVKWLDIDFGMTTVEGIDGFISLNQLDEMQKEMGVIFEVGE